MANFGETLETIRAEEASVRNLFRGDGRRVRTMERSPAYMRNLVEAAGFLKDVLDGRRPMYHLMEAMSTDDFPLLLGDVLDRQLLANYVATPSLWSNYTKRGTVPNFNPVKRTAIDGAEGELERVAELGEYPEAHLDETQDQYSVAKYGRRLDLSWEVLINDDLDAFRSAPERLARGAVRSEDRFATGLFVDANGPHASLYDARYGNIVTGNPRFDIAGLQAAMLAISTQTDTDGNPIIIEGVELVIPPALEVPALNILNALQVEVTTNGGTNDAKLIATNWMRGRVHLTVNPYIPIIANTANGSTSWFLFANPNTGRPWGEVGFLRGFEQPALYERMPNARRVGGGGEVMESFENDSRAWRVRHVFGGTRFLTTGGTKATVASNGSGR
jgi:hypothetical protein